MKGKNLILNQKTHSIVFVIVIVLFSLLFSISALLYPNIFTLTTNWISDLGNPLKNVKGYMVFNIAVVITGAALQIHFYYLIYHIPFTKPWARITIAFLLHSGGLGFALIGIFHDLIQPIHDILAGIAFGSMALGYFLLQFALLRLRYLKQMNFNITVFALVYIQFYTILIAFIIIPVIRGLSFYDFIIWEWMTFFSLFMLIIGNFYLIHNNRGER